MIATVFCQVASNDNTPVGHRPVEVHQVLYDRPNSVERRLARGWTDLAGTVTLSFPVVFAGLVRVRVFGSDGNPIGGEILPTPLTGAHRVRVALPSRCSRSEVERLMRVIRPWTDGQLRRLLSWEPHRLEHITQQTHRPLERLQLLQQAAVLSEQVGVPVEVAYGIGRAGLELTVAALSRCSQQDRSRALERAITQRWIPSLSEGEQERHLARLAVMLGPSARLRRRFHQHWSRWTREELITTVDFTTTAMTLA